MHKVILAALVALAATPVGAADPQKETCYTQRTRPENFVLPRPRSESLALPQIHLPDADTRHEPVSVVLDMHVTATGSVARVNMAESSAVKDWNAAVTQAAQSWAFVPGTVDGEPTAMCFKFRLTATLQGN
jgi:TonB family protein